MDRVAAKIAQEVGVLFEHKDVDPRAGEQKPQHHAGGATAGDAAARFHACQLLVPYWVARAAGESPFRPRVFRMSVGDNSVAEK